ncbi:hypothetical protein ACFV9E_00210 [Streptomyces sp. NPDC059835]|uniref:hypothetical protein n=1 Tax=Streptomyces sp. NPDC059835 TaxID=3346967 RepID=UPI00366850B6
MSIWREIRPARMYLSDMVPGGELKRGDVILGFHMEPWQIVTQDPRPHPTQAGWFLVEKHNATASVPGLYVYNDRQTARVGRIPLTNIDTSKFFGVWQAPCGCVVSNREHCQECGPYNGHSPLHRDSPVWLSK